MRTTIALDPDVQAAVDRIRRDEDIGVREAVNRLARAGLEQARPAPRKRFVQRTARLGIRLDLTSVQDALERSPVLSRPPTRGATEFSWLNPLASTR